MVSQFRIKISLAPYIFLHLPWICLVWNACERHLSYQYLNFKGESTHSVIMTQGKEILSFIVFTELRKAELEIPKSSVIFKNLVW